MAAAHRLTLGACAAAGPQYPRATQAVLRALQAMREHVKSCQPCDLRLSTSSCDVEIVDCLRSEKVVYYFSVSTSLLFSDGRAAWILEVIAYRGQRCDAEEAQGAGCSVAFF